MQVKSIYKYARISAFKAREVTRSIQGLPALDALDVLNLAAGFKKVSPLVLKALKSAIANAENNNNLRAERLVVKEAVVGEGPTVERFQPKARGSAGPIRKRTSHIRIVLTDEVEIQRRDKSKKSSKEKKKASSKITASVTETPETSSQEPSA